MQVILTAEITWQKLLGKDLTLSNYYVLSGLSNKLWVICKRNTYYRRAYEQLQVLQDTYFTDFHIFPTLCLVADSYINLKP